MLLSYDLCTEQVALDKPLIMNSFTRSFIHLKKHLSDTVRHTFWFSNVIMHIFLGELEENRGLK